MYLADYCLEHFKLKKKFNITFLFIYLLTFECFVIFSFSLRFLCVNKQKLYFTNNEDDIRKSNNNLNVFFLTFNRNKNTNKEVYLGKL